MDNNVRQKTIPRASTTTVSVIQFLIFLTLIVGIIMMYTYDEDDTAYTVGKVMAITAGVIIGLNILFILIAFGMVGYVAYRVKNTQDDYSILH